MKKVKKAIIPSAGFGTRFLPYTKSMPKEMLPIFDKPTLQFIVEEVAASGITDILIVTNKHKKVIEDHFDRSYEMEALLKTAGKTAEYELIKSIAKLANVYYIRQQKMRGSGDAILNAKAFVGDEPFAVLYGDDLIYSPDKPCIKQLIDAYDTTGKTIVGVQSVPKSEVYKYGIIKPGLVKGRYSEVKAFVEKPKVEDAPSTLASMGRYVLTPDIFDELEDLSAKLPSGKELFLTDGIARLAELSGVYAYEFEGRRYDVGDKTGYMQASIDCALRDESVHDKLMAYLKELVSKN